jgi:hypothetical protein
MSNTIEQRRAKMEELRTLPEVTLNEQPLEEGSFEERTFRMLNQRSAHTLRMLRGNLHSTFQAIWFPPRMTTTEKMLAALGTNAGKAFDQHALGIQLLLAAGVEIPADEYTPPVAYTRHDDGTITLA